MEHPPELTKAPTPAARRRRFRVALAALIILIFISSAWLFIRPAETKTFWLTPASVQQAAKPGPLKLAWYRFRGMIGSLNRFLPASQKGRVRFDTSIYSLTPSSLTNVDLGTPSAVNTNGARAWIISSASLQSLRAQLKPLPAAALLGSPRMQTTDGVRSQMSIGSTMIVDGKVIPIGLTVDLFPRISKNSLRLVVSVTDTEQNQSLVKTNFAAACAATVPDAGALVINSGTDSEKHYWLVLSPVLVDTNGVPLKH